MNKLFVIRVLGVIGAFTTSVAAALAGDYVTAAGVLSATFGSAAVFWGAK